MEQVERAVSFPYFATVIQRVEQIFEVPENRRMYLNDQGVFREFILKNPRMILNKELAALIDDIQNLTLVLMYTDLGQPDLVGQSELQRLCGATVRRGETNCTNVTSMKIIAKNFTITV